MCLNLKYFAAVIENIGTIIPCDNGIRYIAIHSHLFGLTQFVPYVNHLRLVQYLQSRVAVFRLEILLPLFIVNRIENRRWIYREAVATYGCHIARIHRRAEFLQRPRDDPGPVVTPDVAAKILLQITHAGIGHAAAQLGHVEAHDAGGDVVPVLGAGKIRQILQRAGDHHVQVEVDTAVLPQGQVAQHVGHVTDRPVALLQNAAGVPRLQGRLLHIPLRVDVTDPDVGIIVEMPDDLARAVRELRLADK